MVKNAYKIDLPKILKYSLYKPNQSVLKCLYISRKIMKIHTKKRQIFLGVAFYMHRCNKINKKFFHFNTFVSFWGYVQVHDLLWHLYGLVPWHSLCYYVCLRSCVDWLQDSKTQLMLLCLGLWFAVTSVWTGSMENVLVSPKLRAR